MSETFIYDTSIYQKYFDKSNKLILPPPFSCKKWDGDGLPNIVKFITNKWHGKLIFGGSSLLHCLYFNNEDWGEKDYDIWSCTCIIDEILIYLQSIQDKENIIFENPIICNNYFQKYTGVNIIYNISFNGIKLQLLKLDKFYCIDHGPYKSFIDHIDFSFLKILYDGNMICYYTKDINKVKEKKGTWEQLKIFKAESTILKQFQKKEERILKYKNRGFIFENICNHCNNNKCNFKHYTSCLNTLNELGNIDFSTYHKKCISNSEKLAYLGLLLKTCKITEFHNFFDEWNNEKKIVNYDDDYLIEKIVSYLITESVNYGVFSVVKKIYEMFENTEHKIDLTHDNNMYMYNAVKKNYVNIAKFFAEKNLSYNLKICEDRIVNFSIKSIFDLYIDSNDPMFFKKIIVDSKDSDDCEYCIICKYTIADFKLNCNHNYCNTCFALWLKDNNECTYCKLPLAFK